MAKGGVLGNGLKVGFSTTQSGPWTEIEDILEITFPVWQGSKVDRTTHKVGNRLRRSMPGMIEVGDPQFTVVTDFDPATSPELETVRGYNKDGTNVWWRFEVPVNRAQTLFRGVEFQAGVLSIEPDTPIDDKQTEVFTLNFDGEDLYWDESAGASEI